MLARRAYVVLRAVAVLATVTSALVFGPSAAARLDRDGLILLVGAAVVLMVLSLLRAPCAPFERSHRPTPESDRVAFAIVVLLVVLVRDGWFWAASMNLVTRVFVPPQARRRRLAERVLGGGLRFPPWAALAFVAAPLGAAVRSAAPLAGLAVFVAVAAAFVAAVNFLYVDVVAALRQSRSLVRIWRRNAADLGSFATIAGEAAWAFVVARIALDDGAVVALFALVPLVLLAIVLVRFARTNAKLDRLALSREAVDAMLRASDPRPQVRLLLETIDPRLVREPLEVAAFGRGGDRWSRVSRFGPPVAADLERLGGRALAEVQVTGDDAAIDAPEVGSVHAFAARDAEGGLRGAVVLFRPAGTPGLVAARAVERAASELGPLLGEYGAIAATHTAATIDTLTGLANRRGVTRAFEETLPHIRDGGRAAVLLLDVDHFKSINDLLGHQAGDRTLAAIGRVIGDNIRGVDVAGRFGGEEFLVLLREASRERAMQVAERLRSAIEASGLAYADGKPVTISVGVAYARPADAPADVIERADRALYRAKNAGRNRVVESPLVAI